VVTKIILHDTLQTSSSVFIGFQYHCCPESFSYLWW